MSWTPPGENDPDNHGENRIGVPFAKGPRLSLDCSGVSSSKNSCTNPGDTMTINRRGWVTHFWGGRGQCVNLLVLFC